LIPFPLNPFSLFSKKSLKPSWSYSPQGVVWRILFGKGNRIVGESRDQEKKTVTFFCLDGSSGRPLWENRSKKEPWWAGIEALHQDVILTHGFEQPDMPGHRGIEAWKLETGEELWSNEELTYWFCYRERVYAYRTLFERREGYALDLHSGNVVETYEKGIEELSSVRKLAVQDAHQEELLFPELAAEGQVPSNIQSLLLQETAKKEIVEGIEYVYEDPYLIMNYHIKAQNSTPESLKLDNHLAIIHAREGERIFADVLSKEGSAPVPDSFFVREGSLYYVKDQRTLSALVLPGLTGEVPS